LDAHLEEAGKDHILRVAVDTVSATKPFTDLSLVLVDLSTAGKRLYAGVKDREQRFIASIAKIAIMFAAFQLRKVAKEGAALLTVKKEAEVYAALTKGWGAKIQRHNRSGKGSDNSLPSFGRIFQLMQLQNGAWVLEFATTALGGSRDHSFSDRLRDTVFLSDDGSAADCVRDLGFPFINGALSEAGLQKRGRGLWLSMDFMGHHWDPEAAAAREFSAQASTARVLAEFMTLLQFDELLPGTAAEMFGMMSGLTDGNQVGIGSFIGGGAKEHLSDAEQKTLNVRGKLGYLDAGPYNDSAIVERSSKYGPLKYVAVVLGAKDRDVAIAAGRALDVVLESSRKPLP
jgi:hypothetical protein